MPFLQQRNWRKKCFTSGMQIGHDTPHAMTPKTPGATHNPVSYTTLGHAWQEWWQRSRQRSLAAIHPHAAPWYRWLRRWSSLLVPPVVGLALFVIVILLATHPIGKKLLVTPGMLLAFFVIYFTLGVLYSALLHLAPGHGSWWLALVGGAAAFLVITALVIGGWGAGVIVACLVGLLVVFYVRGHLITVPDNAVQITTCAGAHHRTLRPGTRVLLPGERVTATLDTSEHSFATPAQRVQVLDNQGAVYVARASATVAYRLIIREAHRVLAAPDQWEDHLHELTGDILRQSLADWGIQMLATGGAVPDRLLAKTVLSELRERARAQGVHILWVSLRDIWLAAEDEMAAHDADDVIEAAPYAIRPTPAARKQVRRALPAPTPQAASAHANDGGEIDTAQEPSREALAADVLSDAYEAVREGHVNDPATIRQVAKAFLRVARDPDLSETFPYDANQAARLLLDRALSIEREQQQQHAQPRVHR